MKENDTISKFFIWRLQHLNPRQYLLVLSLITGLTTGLAAVLLKNTVQYTAEFLFSKVDIRETNLIYLAFPLAGILLTVLFIRIFIKDNIGHGITRVLWSISRNKGSIKKHNMYSSIIGSTLTVGFGGSVGLEAPVVYSGSAIGSNLARISGLDYKQTVLLVGCGAAGAIAGIFKAPIAATVFALEVLMLDLSMWSVIPLLLSAVTGSIVSYFLMGSEAVFSFSIQDTFNSLNVPFYILLGIICGLVSVYFSRGLARTEFLMKKIKNDYVKLAFGGIALGLLIYFLPPLFGEGYVWLKEILGGNPQNVANGGIFYAVKDHMWYFLGFLFLVLIFKVVAVGVTTGSGGVGGVFAPSLFMGGITGFLVSRAINNFHFFHYVSERNFALVGMAGFMAGVMHAPLTSIFLIAEITNGYGLFIPLIITSTISFLTHRYFEPYSVYTRRLAEKGELITHHKDKAVLTLLKIEEVLDRDMQTISPGKTLGELVKIITHSKRNIFPVVELDNHFVGIINLDDIRDIIFRQEIYHSVLISTLVKQPPSIVFSTDTMIDVMSKFEKSKVWNLPVIDSQGHYLGMISKARVLSSYRDMMVESSEE